MVLDDASLGGFRPGPPGSRKNVKAHLISKATATATAAAKSVLQSGGTEEAALKTAKAAAQSVLAPDGTDSVISGISSTTFMRRRKAKRQAEVVASMALMTAASNARSRANSVSTDWETLTASTDNNTRSTYPYARNITTRAMIDEPSVLSAASKPTAAAQTTPRSNISCPRRSGPRSVENRNPAENGKTKFFTHTQQPSPSPPPTGRSKPTAPSRPPNSNSLSMMGLFQRKNPKRNSPVDRALKTEEKQVSSIPDKRSKASRERVQINSRESSDSDFEAEEKSSLDSRLQNSSAEEGDDDSDSVASISFDDIESNAKSNIKKKPSKDVWGQLDPLLLSFTNFSCNPFSSVVHTSASDPNSSKPIKSKKKNQKQEKKKSKKQQQQQKKKKSRKKTVERSNRSEFSEQRGEQDHGLDSFEEKDAVSLNEMEDEGRDDIDSLRGDDSMRGGDSYDSNFGREQYVSSSCSEESADSSQLIRGLNSGSSSEGEIQVRSTIRETMEQIVSKSKKGSHFDSRLDTAWKSYESPRQHHGDGYAEFGSTIAKRVGQKSPSKRGANKFFKKRKSKR